MIRIVNDIRYPVKSELISGTERTLYDAFRIAYEKGQVEIVKEINQFQQKLLFDAFGRRAPEVINQLIFLPVYFYHLVSKDDNIRPFLIHSVTVAYKTSSFFFKESAIAHSKRKFNRDLEIECAEKFYEGVLTFYHYISTGDNNNEIEHAFGEFNQMKDDVANKLNYNLKIRELLQQGKTNEIISEKKQYEIEHYSAILHRRAALCLKAWFVFLYSNNELTYDKFSFLYNVVKLKYHYFDDLLDDVIFIRDNELRNFLGVSHWDYIDRLGGEFYSPPSVRDWILHGLTAILLKGDAPQMDISVILKNRDFHFLADNLKSVLQIYRQDLSKWEKFFGLVTHDDQVGQNTSTEELFNQRSREVINAFEKLRSIIREAESTELAEAPINQEKVNRFKEELANKWDKFCVSFDIFYHFNSVEIKDNDKDLPFLGLSLYMDRFKLMFVENGQTIFGSGDIGADVGRRVDNTFIEKLINEKQSITEFDSIEDALNTNLAILSGHEHPPDLIIIPPEFMYATNLTELTDYSGSEGNQQLPFSIWGYYKSIPIVSFYAPILRTQLIILSFKESVKLEIYEGYEYNNKRLHIDIRELKEEEFNRELNKKIPNADETHDISKKRIENDIKSSLYLDIWSKARFSIIDTTSYVVSIIKNIKL